MTAPAMTRGTVRRARRRYKTITGGDLFYRAALILAAASYEPHPQLDLAESLALLLQTWNKDFYTRYLRRSFDQSDFKAIRKILKLHATELEGFRFRGLDSLKADDEAVVGRLFGNFELVLGPVGTAKALHLLAPQFFPLWDRQIAKAAYGIYLKAIGHNADN